MELEKQVKDIEIFTDTTPRVYVKWTNTEQGRDINECYERVVIGESSIYINTHNRYLSIALGHPIWQSLENIYELGLGMQGVTVNDIVNKVNRLIKKYDGMASEYFQDVEDADEGNECLAKVEVCEEIIKFISKDSRI